MKNKKNVVFLIILIISIITVIGGFTYAYFKGQTGSSAKVDVKVETGTVDNLTFDKCNPVNLTMTQTNFGEGTGNQEGITCVKATLTANNTTTTATDTYNVYLDIKENNFEYTTTEQKVEILLQVTDPNGNKVTSIKGLKYNTELQGFDITTKKGLVEIISDYEIKISSAGSKTDEWQIKVIARNLNSDQSINAGKKLRAEALVQKEERFITRYWYEYDTPIIYPNTPTYVSYNPFLTDDILYHYYIYIRTDETSHAACLKTKNSIKDICLRENYWDTDEETTLDKLRNDMISYFGNWIDVKCETSANTVTCNFCAVQEIDSFNNFFCRKKFEFVINNSAVSSKFYDDSYYPRTCTVSAGSAFCN